MATLTVKQAQAKIESKAELAMRQLLASVGEGIVMATPVVTGKTRAHWAGRTTKPRRLPKNPRRHDKTGRRTATAIKRGADRFKIGKIFYIITPLFHTRLLEHGSAHARPYGMVKRTMAGLRNRAARIASVLRKQ